MKLFVVAFAGLLLAAVPVSVQTISTGPQLSTAAALTYGHARRVDRRMDRRDYRYTRRAVRHGAYYGGASYYAHPDGASGYPYSAPYYAYRGVYGAPVARRVARRAVVRQRW